MVSAVMMAVGVLAATPAIAIPGCSQYGPNTISSTFGYTCTLYSGSSLHVTAPNGVISVTGAEAVVVSPWAPVGVPINNEGVIESLGTNGIMGSAGGAATAIRIYDSSSPSSLLLDNLINAAGGSIRAIGGAGSSDNVAMSGSGGAATAISVSSGQTGALTNFGTIAATGGAGGSGAMIGPAGPGGTGIGIDIQSATVGDVVNSGVSSQISGTGGNAGSSPMMFSASAGAGIGINVANSIVNSIQNDGTITGSGGASPMAGPFLSVGGAAYGIKVSGGAVTNGIINNGTITASSTAGTATGIRVEGGAIVGAIRNDGAITATSSGLPLIGQSVGIDVAASTVGSIDVAGTINASTAISVDSTSTVTNGINVSGQLTGSVLLGNATLNLDGSRASISGQVTGGTASVVNINGSYTSGLANAFYVGAFNIADGAVFNMGSGVVLSNAAMTNSGTLAVAPGFTATITGNYIQTTNGAFQTGIGENGSYGKLVVTGTADLSASNKINVNVAGAPSLVAGTTVQSGVITAGTLIAGPTFRVTDNSALFDFIASRNGNAVDLCVARAGASSCDANAPVPTPTPEPTPTPTPTPTPNPVITVVSSVTSAHNNPGLGAAQVFDALIGQGAGAPAAMAPVITALGTLSTEQQVSDAVKQTLPLLTGGMSAVNTAAMHATNRVIQSRQEANRGLSSGDDFVSDRQLWFKPVGSWARQGDRDGVSGYSANTYGMLVGADGVVSEKVRIGGAFSYMHSRIDGNSAVAAQTASVDGYRLIGYGSYSLDARTDVSVQADVGTGHNEGQRNIAFGGLSGRASSSYDSWNTHLGVGIGRIFDVTPKTTLTPSLRADYTFIQDSAYTETGADALSLAVGKNSARELILSTDMRLNQAVTEQALFTANLGVGYDALGGQSSITASYVGGGAQFITRGMPPARWLMRGGLGFVVTSSKAMEFSVRYDAEVREHFTNQTASVKLRVPF
ncbi:autotransporter outer membrane beta-barrel domain-containing protein [Cupriavidus necator]|nr:autotransporter outer membrane beta-barrel domain-containing protein [Cupriavidus necator]